MSPCGSVFVQLANVCKTNHLLFIGCHNLILHSNCMWHTFFKINRNMWGIQPHVFTVQPRAYLRSRRNRIDRAVEKKLRKGERGRRGGGGADWLPAWRTFPRPVGSPVSPDSALADPPEQEQSDRHQHYRSPDKTVSKVRNRLAKHSSKVEQIRLKEAEAVTKRCRLFWLINSALVYEPKCGGRGRSCGVSANGYSCTHVAQINVVEI